VNLRRPAGGLWRVAHRGGAALGPENSLAALEAALGAGVDMVELDVVESGGQLWLAHSVAQLIDDSPTLEQGVELFARVTPEGVYLDLDLKAPGAEATILDALARHDLLERTILTSFHSRPLRDARALEPGITTGLSYPNDRYGLHTRRPFAPFVAPGLAALRRALPTRIGGMLRRAQAQAAMLHHALITPALVERCHENSAAVFAWTVEAEADLRRVASAGVDGVIVDDPSLFGG
jgi:glycerophosphoryl diester phosphodiesterase